MSDSVLAVGNKIELSVQSGKNINDHEHAQVYVSQIVDIRNGEIIAAMPIFEGHIIPLGKGNILETFFYTKKGIFNCESIVADRGREDNIHVMKLELKTELKKFQRREFYRLPCTIECYVRKLDESELIKYKKENIVPELTTSDKKGMIVDISGGGIRMATEFPFEKNDYVALRFPIEMNIGKRDVETVGKIILSLESTNTRKVYDSRIQFKGVPRELRDAIVKYIFEQQRRIQQRERGGYFGKENIDN